MAPFGQFDVLLIFGILRNTVPLGFFFTLLRSYTGRPILIVGLYIKKIIISIMVGGAVVLGE